MKRVALISFHKTTNYGCALQQAALFTVVSRMGYDTTFIANTQTPRIKHIYRMNVPVLIKKGFKKVFSGKKTKRQVLDYNGERVKIFRDFQKSVLTVSDECSCYSDLQALNSQFDAFVCGSDQIWSPSWFDEKYFLPFVDAPEKLIAYAPSFGVSSVDDKEICSFMSEAISRFPHLSVREQQGVDIIKKLTGREAKHVVDPTLLLTPDEWRAITKTDADSHDEKYIICYFLGETEKYIEAVKALSKKTGLKVLMIPVYNTDMDIHVPKVEYPVGPREFVSLISNAEYVCTDSFHGAVFALNFCKQFAVFERDRRKDKASMNSRLYSLLDTFGLQDRLIDYKDKAAITRLGDLDYSLLVRKLDELRTDSLYYLQNALSEATSFQYHGRKSLATYDPSENRNFVIDSDLCCGCTACATVCPTGALTIEMNAVGFRHYIIDKNKCVECGLCKKVCPMQKNDAADIMSGRLFGVKANDKELLMRSSSGGFCHLAALYLNTHGYHIAGCEYNANRECAEHSIVGPNHPEELSKFQGSKYIQSDMGDVFKRLLKLEKAAFFGTPCQVAGLHKLLVREGKRDSFVLIEVICRGVPSSNGWKKCLTDVKSRLKLSSDSKIYAIFRSNRLGWNPLTITMKNGSVELTESEKKSDFYALFLRSDSLNESCYECPFRTRSNADVRVGDFWGRAYLGDPDGVSEVIALTQSGAMLMDEISGCNSANIKEFEIEELLFSQCLHNSDKPLYYHEMLRDLTGKKNVARIRKEYYSSFEFKEKLKSVYGFLKNLFLGVHREK